MVPASGKTVLVLGAGYVSQPVVDYLASHGHQVVIGGPLEMATGVAQVCLLARVCVDAWLCNLWGCVGVTGMESAP